MNKNLSKQFISTFDPIKINKARTLLDKEKKDVVKKLTTGLTNRKITDTIDSAIELHCSGHIDLVLKKLFNYYYSEINMHNLSVLTIFIRLHVIIIKHMIVKQSQNNLFY